MHDWGSWVSVLRDVPYLMVIMCPIFYMGVEVLTEVKMSMLVFWVVTPCGLVGRYLRFGEYTASILRAENVDCFFEVLVSPSMFITVRTSSDEVVDVIKIFRFSLCSTRRKDKYDTPLGWY
jgi:hypothetical protein